MVNFFDEILKLSGQENAEFVAEYKIINISSKIVYIEGFKKLTIAEKTIISVRTKKSKIIILGESLIIKKMSKDFLVITGLIKDISTEVL